MREPLSLFLSERRDQTHRSVEIIASRRLHNRVRSRSGVRLPSLSFGGGGFATGRISSRQHRLFSGRLSGQLVSVAGLHEHTRRAELEGLSYRWKSSSGDSGPGARWRTGCQGWGVSARSRTVAQVRWHKLPSARLSIVTLLNPITLMNEFSQAPLFSPSSPAHTVQLRSANRVCVEI